MDLRISDQRVRQLIDEGTLMARRRSRRGKRNESEIEDQKGEEDNSTKQ